MRFVALRRRADVRSEPEYLLDNRRKSAALLFSLLIHAGVLSLIFGGRGVGLSAPGSPWRPNGDTAASQHAIYIPVQLVAEPPALVEQPANFGPAANAKTQPQPAPAPSPAPESAPGLAPERAPGTLAAAATVPAPLPMGPDVATLIAPVSPVLKPLAIAARPSVSSPVTSKPANRDSEEAVPTPNVAESKEAAPEPVKPVREAKTPAPPEPAQPARLEADEQQTARLDALREAATQQALAQAESARLEAARQELARQELARQELARQELARQELARQAATRQEAARLEAERQEAAKMEAARQAAALQEAARLEAIRQERDRIALARSEAERLEAARLEAIKRENAEQEARSLAARQAMGRKLDEEAAMRDAAQVAARQPATLLPYSRGLRRVRLFGRTDPNTELVLYAEAVSRKLQLNQTFEPFREAVKQRHNNPVVTVAIRSDGSVESVTVVLSSGVPAIDEAVKRTVLSQAPYPGFPPALANQFDVVEIRRTWSFDMAVRLY